MSDEANSVTTVLEKLHTSLCKRAGNVVGDGRHLVILEVARAVSDVLDGCDSAPAPDLAARVKQLEEENAKLRAKLENASIRFENYVSPLVHPGRDAGL